MNFFSRESQFDLLERLQRIVARTEEIYLGLGSRFPDMLREMEIGIAASRDTGDAVLRNRSADTDAESTLGGVIRAVQEQIDGGCSALAALHRQGHGLFDDLDRQIGKLEHLEGMIDRIRDDSIEMELVSLNAMTVALKAGTAGRAFSYITEELKRLSTRTIVLTEDITRRGNDILDLFRTFRSALEDLEERQDRISAEFRNRLMAGFDEFRRGAAQIQATLRSISEKSAAVREPIARIMEEVQLQDIIRQSVDHVMISIRELRTDTEAPDAERRLDELAFLRTLPDLCVSLLDDIAGRIEKSLGVFRRQSDDLMETVHRAEQERTAFVRSVTDDDGSEGSLHALFDTSGKALQELLQDLSQLIGDKEQLSLTGKRLMKNVGELEENFRSFSVLVSRFHNIDIASRIEAAKQSVLQQMQSTVEAMSGLTDRIDRDVSRALEETKLFISESGIAFETFAELRGREERFAAGFTRDIRSSCDSLFSEKNRLADLIGSFSLYTARFLDLTESTRTDTEALSGLLSEIGELRKVLEEIRGGAERELAALLEKSGRREWKLTDGRLKDIVRRFTIFTHKKTAADLAGFQVEDGVDAGEVTLFP